MRFSEIRDAAAVRDGVWTAHAGEDWLQGRSLFGGLQSAMALRAMKRVAAPDAPLRVLQTTFVAPVGPGAVAVRPRVMRQGKNVTQIEARIVDGTETAALFVGIFGRGRASRVAVAPAVSVVEDEVHDDHPAPPGVAFAQHFRLRRLRGDPLVSGSCRTDAVLEVGMLEVGMKD